MGAYDKVNYHGFVLNERTLSALKYAEDLAGIPILLAQGSYNGGKNAVSQSGGTHDGGGVVDLRVRQYTTKQRRKVVRYMRKAGFAAWYRKEIPGLWGPHIHAVLIGDKEMSAEAKQQVYAYDRHRNGLANNAYDKAWRPKRRVRFSYRKNKPVPR